MFCVFVSCSMSREETQAAKRVGELRREIEKHNRLYYEEAAPTIGDRDYDRLYKKHVDLEAEFPNLAAPDSYQYHLGMGWSYLKLGQRNDARAAFQRALKLEPSDEAVREGLRRAGI